uniref:PAR14 n=1 Tax=Poecilia reticulata TaxID=8081 RepID=A0A3P9Q382_POERE
MAEEYAFPVLVELEESNTPRLKNKLVKYFQSKKSNGGDCEVDYESGSQTALLRFRKEEDQKNVLGKETHQISLDEGVLKMTVPDHAGTDKQSPIQEPNPVDEGQTGAKGKDGDSDDEEQCSKLAVLGNIPESVTSEFLEMLVESILRDLSSPAASEDYNLELIPDISSAVVTFQSGKDNIEFIERCPQIRMFTKKNLSVRPLETTKKIVVEGVLDCSEDMLCLYFEDKGGDVEDVQLNEVEQSAVVTFKNHQGS